MDPTQQQQAAAQVASPALTAQDLTAAMQAAIQATQPQPQQQQLSPEQIDSYLNPYKPHPQLLSMMFGDAATDETRMSAINALINGATQNATARAQILTQNYFDNYHQHLAPDLEDLRGISQERFFSQLYDGHDGLKQYDPLLKQMLPQFEQMPGYPSERPKRAEFIRNHAIEMIKQSVPNFDPKSGPQSTQQNPSMQSFFDASRPQFSGTQQQQHQPQQQAPKMASLPSFGGGGQGASNGGNQSPNGGPGGLPF